MKEIVFIPFLLALLLFGVVLYASGNDTELKPVKPVKQQLVKCESIDLKPGVLVI